MGGEQEQGVDESLELDDSFGGQGRAALGLAQAEMGFLVAEADLDFPPPDVGLDDLGDVVRGVAAVHQQPTQLAIA